jgi:multidrug transporter EmrE-like cation transporter
MTASGYALILCTAAIMASSNMLMKHGISRAGGFTFSVGSLSRIAMQPSFTAGFLMAGIAAILWFQILSTQKLSVCYPIFVSLTYGMVTLGAFLLFRETLSVQKIAGLIAIVVGIVFVARG